MSWSSGSIRVRVFADAHRRQNGGHRVPRRRIAHVRATLAVEKYNLLRVFGDSTVNVRSPPRCSCSPIHGDELQHRLAFSGAPTARVGDVGDAVGDALDYLVDGRAHTVESDLFATILNKTTTAYFAAYIKRAHGESVMIQYDPTNPKRSRSFAVGICWTSAPRPCANSSAPRI